ncbi:MAG: NUDIX hydrolase [Candidatus Omnitrophica bacterium]|nr:NUDIX hydrolase [Candidatus Omnitrophota bacterium]
MAQEIFRHIKEAQSSLCKITFCLYDRKAYTIFKQTVFRYLDYIVNKLGKGPFVTVDAIIEMPEGIVLIKRSNPPFGWALPGGFVDYAESLEEAVRREAKEETGLDLEDLKQFHTYSEPLRDPRFHTISTVYIAKGCGVPKSGSDAATLNIVKPAAINDYNLAFDHKKIIEDYLK